MTLDVDLVTIPLYIYKTVDAFRDSMCDYVRTTLQRGVSGWAVPDCHVTLTECAYDSPSSSARDFRKLTTVVLRMALRDAGTVVCEPIDRFRLDAPRTSLSGLLQLLARLRAVPDPPAIDGEWLDAHRRDPCRGRGAAAAAAPPGLTQRRGRARSRRSIGTSRDDARSDARRRARHR